MNATTADLAARYADAHRAHELARLDYRQAHARVVLALTTPHDRPSDWKTPPEWKVTATWEASEAFALHKRTLADTEHARILARAAYLDACPHAAHSLDLP